MISSQSEYQKVREELDHLARWLSRLESENVTIRKGLTVASIRKMICRLQEELAEYEAAGASTLPVPKEQTESNDGDIGQDA